MSIQYYIYRTVIQEADGVRIPEVLVPFMGGITFLPFVRDSKPADKSSAAGAEKKEKGEFSHLLATCVYAQCIVYAVLCRPYILMQSLSLSLCLLYGCCFPCSC